MLMQLNKRLRKRIGDCVMCEMAAAFIGRLRKPLLIMSASTMLGIAAIAPNATLAFGPPPPPAFGGPPAAPALAGPPPAPGVGGAPGLPRVGGPAGLSRFGGPLGAPRLGGRPGFQGNGRGVQGNPGVQGRSAGYGYGRSARYGYSNDRSGSRYRYGRQYGVYGVYASGNGGYAYADDGCTYTYIHRRHAYRRVLVCSGN